MIVKRIVKDKEGNLEATLMLSPEQAAFLINMGLVTLVSAGSVKIQDMSQEEFDAEIQKEQAKAEGKAQSSFLEVDDTEKQIH